MSFPTYINYRDSRVEWFGEIPDHWAVTSLKRVIDPLRPITYGIVQAGPHIPDGIPYVRPADMTAETGVIDESALLRTSSEIAAPYKRSELATGDIICSIGPSFGKVMIVPPSLNGANLTQGTARIAIGKEHSVRYFFWALRSTPSFAQWECSVGGATFRALNLGPLCETTVLEPSISEQSAIANFLDRETAKIDALVQEQQRLIELLKEKRLAVISHAVTKGLNPDVPMKDSGVEWLGEVPEHWEIDKFSRLISIAEGQVDPRIEPYASMLLIAPNHIESSTGRLLGRESAAEQGADSGKYAYETGAVLYSKIRPALAKAVIAPAPGLCSADMYPLNSRGDLQHRYLLFLLLTPGFTAWASLESDRVAMPKINREKLNELRLPVPPVTEQIEIEGYLNARLADYDELVGEAEIAINLLKERRSALISAAVTGKIDVRGLVSREAEAA